MNLITNNLSGKKENQFIKEKNKIWLQYNQNDYEDENDTNENMTILKMKRWWGWNVRWFNNLQIWL